MLGFDAFDFGHFLKNKSNRGKFSARAEQGGLEHQAL
jgi:hypothetical protein